MPIERVTGGGGSQPLGGRAADQARQDAAAKAKARVAGVKKPAETKPEVERILGGPMSADAVEATVKVLGLHREITAGDETKVDAPAETLEALNDPTFDAVVIASSVCGAWLGGVLAEEGKTAKLSEQHRRRLAEKEEQVRKLTTVTGAEGATGGIVDTKA